MSPAQQRSSSDTGLVMATTESTALHRGSVRNSERAVAPDLARGAMLLLIALANTAWYLYGAEPGPASIHPREGSIADRITQAVLIITVDSRVYPMFAFLFGYGLVQVFRRQTDAGTPERQARRLLQRRNGWLLVFGLVHAALLWGGDVLGAYGLAGLVLVALFLRRRDRTLKVWAIVLTALMVVAALFSVVGAYFAAQEAGIETQNFLALGRNSITMESYLRSIVDRVTFWPFLSLSQGLLLPVVPVAILSAFVAARHRVLEQPGDHLPLLRRVAVIGIAVAWLGAVPQAMHHLEVLPIPDQVAWVFSSTQGVTGLFGGLGYVALFGLLGHRLAGARPPAFVRWVQSVGKRSLSCYLAQSLVSAPLLAAWGLGLGARMGSLAMAGYAVLLWGLTVLAAGWLERTGRRGPAELLLRRLAYRRLRDREPGVGTSR